MMKIPDSHQTVMPYLMLNDAEGFLQFCTNVFHANLLNKALNEEEQTIRHAEIQIGDSTIMFTQSTDKWPETPANLFIYVENADQSYQQALNAGAESVMELSDQSYGRTCGVKDPCNNVWWITSL